ncbi:MAG TPA: hypothetical protein VFW64_12345 [Pseudonocardiaceae bacterium]|nr:hypothetical protein [Pseudonocardiaceae bacterium]
MERQRGRRTTWAAGLVVAAGAGVATAHGLFQVAAAARVPALIAWLYPLITDGLALVAYAATARLTDGGRRYAAVIVVLAAGLSGLAQAVYLAGGIGQTSSAPVGLRFGVGAWPAVAAALTAHLLHLISTGPAVCATAQNRDQSRPLVPVSSRSESRPPERDNTGTTAGTTPGPETGTMTAHRLKLVPPGRGEAQRAMRQHWVTERAAGRTPSGAELDRVGQTKDLGRRLRRGWLADEKAAGDGVEAGR